VTQVLPDSQVRLEAVAGGFTYPTSLAFAPDGTAYIAEAGLPFGGAPRGGRIWRLAADGTRELLAAGLNPPVNGVTVESDGLLVSEGGAPARIRRLRPDGTWQPVVEGLPGPGNYQTNMTALGPDGKIYFSQGSMTNTGIIGLDAYDLGWLRHLPHSHDIPGHDIVLTGVNVETADPRAGARAHSAGGEAGVAGGGTGADGGGTGADGGATAVTGAFAPFGVPTRPGQRVPAGLPCTAAIMRCEPDGSGLELVAWGLRNAYGLGFLPDGRLLAIDQGADDRGSRPVGNVPDLLYEVRPGRWYGWPDFFGGEPITAPTYLPTRGPRPDYVLANHDELPPPEPALVRFPPHCAATKFAVTPAGSPWRGQLVVAMFGDEIPMTAPAGPPVGRALALVDPADWSTTLLPAAQLRRPIDVAVNPADGAVYALDFGHFEASPGGEVAAQPGTGALWRLSR
jgi:glucose/arabinose dehydrogenase